jgi:hypothetical protein
VGQGGGGELRAASIGSLRTTGAGFAAGGGRRGAFRARARAASGGAEMAPKSIVETGVIFLQTPHHGARKRLPGAPTDAKTLSPVQNSAGRGIDMYQGGVRSGVGLREERGTSRRRRRREGAQS